MSSLPQFLVEPSSAHERIEGAIADILQRGTQGAPPRLKEALAYAVFPGGARLRPRLCTGVAFACGGASALEPALASAVALELVHCASLVHDDMPCFDDADLRRGKPTVHRHFGEATALLVGDALIVLAFETLGRARAHDALAMLALATGPARGIIAGQAWENEVAVPLDAYHRAKTAALFDAAAGMGALAADADPRPWREVGELVGRAYQAADDLADVLAAANTSGKTPGRDAALNRPSAVRTHGVDAAKQKVIELLGDARARVPADCRHPDIVDRWLDELARKMVRDGVTAARGT